MTGKTTPLPSPQRGVAPSTVIPAGRLKKWPATGALKRLRKAQIAAVEFFAARISNPHTRRDYARIVRCFLAWCEDEGLELPRVSADLASRVIDELPGDSATINQVLVALRHFFDTLVTRIIVKRISV